MPKSPNKDAPRLRAYLERLEGARLLRMKRADWAAQRPRDGFEATIDLDRTPLAQVASRATCVAATAELRGSSGMEVAVYRHDPRDDKPYNVDRCSVWEDLPSTPDFHEIVAAASTDYDDAMRDFLSENVFFVPKGISSGHWLDETELPGTVRFTLLPDDQLCAG